MAIDVTSAAAGDQEGLRSVSTDVAERVRRDDAARPRAQDGRLQDLLFACAVLANVVVALSARQFPYGDTLNHLARYGLIGRYWWGEAPADVIVRLEPTAYIGMDAVGALLVSALGAERALAALAVLAVMVMPLGMYALLRSIARERRGWALVGALMAPSWFVLQGMLSYAIGVGLALFWLAGWWRGRSRPSTGRRLLLAVGAIGLFLVHLSAALSILVVLGIDVLFAVRRRLRDRRDSEALRSALSTFAAVFIAVAVVWLLSEQMADTNAGGRQVGVVFRTLQWKILALGAPFYALSRVQTAVIAIGYVLAFGLFLWSARGSLRPDVFLISSACLLVLFAIFPVELGSAGGLDVRWLMPAYLLVFCTASARPEPRQRYALLVLLGISLVNSAVLWAHVRRMDVQLTAYDEVLEQIPARTTLLPIDANPELAGRVGPYDGHAFWHVLKKHGRVPGIFSVTPPAPDGLSYEHFSHFELLDPPYIPPAFWGDTLFTPLDWSRIAEDHDYIVAAGRDPRILSHLDRNAEPVLRRGDISLYRVRRAGADPAR